MSQPTSSIHNLGESSDESVRTLIQALIPDAALGSNGKLNGQDITKLTEKLSELVGPSAVQSLQRTRNERGELVNEEDLPIMDITEPVEVAITRTTASQPPVITVEPLVPLFSLPPTTQERLREKRNAILDFLEEEEAKAEQNEKRRESESREEILRKCKEEAAREKDKMKEARELQKKMGRALLQNIGKAREKEEKERETQRLLDEEADRRKSPSMKKKTVAFAEAVENLEASAQEDWGDVAPARLGHSNRPTLMSQNLLDNLPMKPSVVERVPGGQGTLPKSPRPTQQTFDSDDESDPGADSGSETEAGVDDEPVLERDDVDFDFALHQREIAMEYHRKRTAIAEEATAAITNHSHNTSDIPENTKPAMSQFRASRIASAYNASTPTSEPSLGTSVLPSSSAKTIQRAVRTGKVDSDGKLIGGEADSASEEENEGIQEVLDLLRKGEVYNIGPDGNYLHTIPPRRENEPPSTSTSSLSTIEPAEPLPPPSMLSKTSKFKASRPAVGRPVNNMLSIPDPSLSETPSPSVTPVSYASRSSPKLDSPRSSSSTVAERIEPIVHSPSPEKLTSQTSSAFSTLIDSPAFPAPFGSSSASTSSPVIIPSPSFPPPLQSSSSRPQRPPTVLSSTVRESAPQSPQPSTGANPPNGRPEKKVSRFKVERM